MPLPDVAARQVPRPRGRRGVLAWLLAAGLGGAAWGQNVEVMSLAAVRDAEAVTVDYQLRVALPRAAEEAALRGVPIYFNVTATLWKPRWYWRDDRIARARREWRLTYQPLTSTWRVSQGGLGQSHASLAEAMATMTRAGGWRIADAAAVDIDSRHYLEFEWRLDTTQLPRPLQIGLTSPGAANEWALGVERSVALLIEAAAKPDAK